MNIEAPWVLNFVKDIWIMFIPDLSEPLIFPDLGKIASSRRYFSWWRETIMRKPNGGIYAVRYRWVGDRSSPSLST